MQCLALVQQCFLHDSCRNHTGPREFRGQVRWGGHSRGDWESGGGVRCGTVGGCMGNGIWSIKNKLKKELCKRNKKQTKPAEMSYYQLSSTPKTLTFKKVITHKKHRQQETIKLRVDINKIEA